MPATEIKSMPFKADLLNITLWRMFQLFLSPLSNSLQHEIEAWMAHSDGCPICDQEVTGSVPAWSSMEIDHEIFSMVILSLLLIQEGQLSVSGERMCTSTGYRIACLPRWLSWMHVQVLIRRLSRSATSFPGDWSWKIFHGHSFPSADSRRAIHVVSFWQKNVHNTS